MEVCEYSYLWWYRYFKGSWVSFITTDEFSVKVTKITSRIGFMNPQPALVLGLLLTQWIITVLSKGSKPDNFK